MQSTHSTHLGLQCATRPPPPKQTNNRLPSGQQLVYFFSLLGGGAVFLFMAFFIGLPTLLLSPSKFALFFTLGCCFVLAGFAALKGWRSQLAAMMQRERLPFSLGANGCMWLGWVA
jgi:hypothetical protein